MPFGVGPQYLNPYMGYSSTQGPPSPGTTARGGTTTAGNLPGAPSFAYSSAYGGIPQVPSPITTAAGSVTGNLGNLGSIYNLTGNVNPFNTAQQMQQLESMIPEYGQATSKSSQNILQELSGQVPSDVINQLVQGAAERGVITGGGPNVNASYLRALGLTSLGMQQQGQRDLSAAVARTPLPALSRPESFFVNPATMQEAQTAANLYGSAPVPSAAAAEAMRAAQAGVGYGRGSVPSAPGITAPTRGGYGGTGTPGVYNSLATGTTSSNPPPDAYSRWRDWYNQTVNPARAYGESEADAWGSIGVDIYGPNAGGAGPAGQAGGGATGGYPYYGSGEFNPGGWMPDMSSWSDMDYLNLGDQPMQGPADMSWGTPQVPDYLGAPSVQGFDSTADLGG